MAQLSWPGWLVTLRDALSAQRLPPIPLLTGLNVSNFVERDQRVTATSNCQTYWRNVRCLMHRLINMLPLYKSAAKQRYTLNVSQHIRNIDSIISWKQVYDILRKDIYNPADCVSLLIRMRIRPSLVNRSDVTSGGSRSTCSAGVLSRNDDVTWWDHTQRLTRDHTRCSTAKCCEVSTNETFLISDFHL